GQGGAQALPAGGGNQGLRAVGGIRASHSGPSFFLDIWRRPTVQMASQRCSPSKKSGNSRQLALQAGTAWGSAPSVSPKGQRRVAPVLPRSGRVAAFRFSRANCPGEQIVCNRRIVLL